MPLKNLAEGQEIAEECVVSGQRKGRTGFEHTITDGIGEIALSSEENYRPGTELFVKGTVIEEDGALKLKPEFVQEREGAYEGILGRAEENAQVEVREPIADGLMEELAPRIELAARKLLAAKKTGRFCLLRFHSDADGIVGAISIDSVLKTRSFQQNSAIYRIHDAMQDMGVLRHEKKPLAILVDIGSGEESEEGLRLLKAGGAEVLLIDHHPPCERVEEYCSVFLSPWAVRKEESASTYPAGYLALEAARACGSSGLEPLAAVSCAGDRSEIMEVTGEDRDTALAIDFMATHPEFGNSLESYRNALENNETYASILVQAKEKLENVRHELKKRMKKRSGGKPAIYTVDLEGLGQKEFPGRGKLTTRAFDLVASEDPVVVIGAWQGGMSIRISAGAAEMGANANMVIEDLKKRMGELVLGGGGHGRAASLRVRREFTKEIVDEIVDILSQLHASQPQP